MLHQQSFGLHIYLTNFLSDAGLKYEKTGAWTLASSIFQGFFVCLFFFLFLELLFDKFEKLLTLACESNNWHYHMRDLAKEISASRLFF
jgi:hypothetical protein